MPHRGRTVEKRSFPRAEWAACLPVLIVCAGIAGGAVASDFQILTDSVGEARILRTDPGGNGPVNPQLHRLPDLKSISIGTWAPVAPEGPDPFEGQWDSKAEFPFLRVEVRFAGLLNPPGFTRVDGEIFDPFEFGDHPVFGYIEFDADRNEDTGGDLADPDIHFLGAAARFGGLPSNVSRTLLHRFARDSTAFGLDCDEEPLISRSGEEFHLAFFRRNYERHVEIEGSDPRFFTAGETWVLKGRWLHRAHGFEPFGKSCFGCQPDGSYMPSDQPMQWRHDVRRDETTVSLLYPLNQRAANAMAGYPGEENMNGETSDQWSIHEALHDLNYSARIVVQEPPQACSEIITDWAQTDPQEHLRPERWLVNALLATTYAHRVDGDLVWSDVYPDVTPGDIDGSRKPDRGDYEAVYRVVVSGEGGEVAGFARDFSILDVNYDGVIDARDAEAIATPCDMDLDGDVDLEDYRAFVVKKCGFGPGQSGDPLRPSCILADADFDGDVDLADFREFQNRFTGDE